MLVFSESCLRIQPLIFSAIHSTKCTSVLKLGCNSFQSRGSGNTANRYMLSTLYKAGLCLKPLTLSEQLYLPTPRFIR